MERLACASGAERVALPSAGTCSSDWFPDQPQPNLPVVKNGIGSADDRVVANGFTLGGLPTSARDGRKIVPLGIELRRLARHSALILSQQRPRSVRQMLAWLMESWNPSKLPWFVNEFVVQATKSV